MHFVSHFVAEAIVLEVGSDSDNVIVDSDDEVEVIAVPCELHMDAIKEYVVNQHGDESDADYDIESSFSDVDLTSTLPTTFCWPS